MFTAKVYRLDRFVNRINYFWERHVPQLIGFSGVGLLLWAWGLQQLVLHPSWHQSGAAQSGVILFGIMVAGMFIFLLAALKINLLKPEKKMLVIILVVGLVMRLLMLTAPPLGNEQAARYLWNGAVSAQGFNPYDYTPAKVLGLSGTGPGTLPPSIGQLTSQHLELLNTIAQGQALAAPPVALVFMALAYKLKAWSMVAWRVVLLLIDVIMVLLLFSLCRRWSWPWTRLLLYWWNPLVILEFYNRAQLGLWAWVLVLPALWATVANRRLLASALLAMATAIAYWPGLLLPLVLGKSPRSWWAAIKGMGVFILILALLSVPMIYGYEQSHGSLNLLDLLAQGPNTLFSSLSVLGAGLLGWVSSNALVVQYGTLVLVSVILLAWMVGWALVPAINAQALMGNALCMSLGLFVLSPLQVPWVFALVLPLLVFIWSPTITLMSITMTLSYLYPYGLAQGWPSWLLQGLLWLQIMPAGFILIGAILKKIRSRNLYASEANH